MHGIAVHPGQVVVTADGTKVGTVKAVRGQFLKVNARWRPDFWIDEGLVASADEVARLTVRKDRLPEHKLARPGPGGDDRRLSREIPSHESLADDYRLRQ